MDEDWLIYFDYSFRSCPDAERHLDPGYFIKDISMNIFKEADLEDDASEELLIGKAGFKVIYADQAINAGVYLSDVFDCYEYSFRHGQEIIDFSAGEIKGDIQEFFDYGVISSNICIIQEIAILPEYRGHKIAVKAVRDIIFNYSQVCNLFVIQPFPMQFEKGIAEGDEWVNRLNLDKFTSPKETAFQKLRDYYLKYMGFQQIPGYKNLLFYCSSFKNERLDGD